MENKCAFLKGFGELADIPVDVVPFDIGRCRTAKLVIPNVNISRSHCRLKLGEDKTWIIEDLSSSGTYLNDELIGAGNSVILSNNDLVRLGPRECQFMWQFRTGANIDSTSNKIINIMDAQSRSIVDFCSQKEMLKRKIILNRESCQEIEVQKEQFQMQCFSQVKALEEKYNVQKNKLENQSQEMQVEIERKAEEEKKRMYSEMEEKVLNFQAQIMESNEVEKKLKLEIELLQEKIISEQHQWENRFIEEKRMLEEKINVQEEKLASEKLKLREISQLHEQQLEEKLKKEEEEKKLLLEKLRELEDAKEALSQKLRESNELHVLDKARLEESMRKELVEKEESIMSRLQGQVESLKKAQLEIESNLKAELEEREGEKNQDLLAELNRVKNTLIQTECRQKILEKELAEASLIKDEASKVKSSILANIADLMEAELQCSVCSELLITATTLNCTHTFCKYCINRWKKKKKNCPICRKNITSENRSIVMDNYIDKMIETLPEEFRTRRKAIIMERSADEPRRKNKKSNSSAAS